MPNSTNFNGSAMVEAPARSNPGLPEQDTATAPQTKTMMLRILLVEDDPERIALFTAWSPLDVRLVVARGGGRALGLLERDPGRVYAGLMLDHDLPGQAVNDIERNVTGTQVSHCIQRYVLPDVPVLIHSMNPAGARRMAGFLTTAGFDVTVIPMAKMDECCFLAWLDTVRSIHEWLGPE